MFARLIEQEFLLVFLFFTFEFLDEFDGSLLYFRTFEVLFKPADKFE
jgi:hypothetical protein